MKTTYDYIVVGGGSAGCVLAARLSENPQAEVLLIEAGKRDSNPYIHIPAGFAKMTTGPLTWGLETVPQRHARDRVIPMAQGKVLGGGSSINAQVFTRGHPTDYDRWASSEGCPGWSFAEIQRYFLRAEGNSVLSGDWHGTDGPLSVSNLPSPHPLSLRFVQACQEYGMPYNPDFNRAEQAGASIYQTTSRSGQRCSTARGYLKPVLSRPNLTLRTSAEVRRLIVKSGRVTGIELADVTYRAEAEVLLCAGGLGSARLLMLSGIGPADHLRDVGVNVVHDLPGVGSALQDHFVIDIICQLKDTETLNRYDKPHWMAWAGLQWALFGTGPATSNVAEGGAFWRSSQTTDVPDLQFHFLPGVGAEAGVTGLSSGVGATLNAYFVRPLSRGSLRLRSADPQDKPLLDPNYLAEPGDVAGSIDAVEVSREIMRQPAFTDVMKAEVEPGAKATSRADLEDYVRQNGRTGYHPVGTCRMGSDDMAVVSPDLRLRGLDGLRVCDSSVMPSIVGSNTNAPTVMIAERAADLVRGNRIPA
ncbi:GMC family oxidoreductase [Ruegeria sp. EL01]|jgi:choline dehydrogenase-like flavoprotein|uniref:GMC family oxidoreductase n=1 Tax=Ruegeria sp. EL01 TaxID=2107578 RepID=UPI000EA834AB|nr:GMC family oxidoreductase N-terminal domain-containing protein [Ruegeria sp. EL01]